MDSMWSDSTLGIPKEVLAILAAIDGKPYGKAVWTLAKHRSGYSLKLFWGVEQKSSLKSLNSAHPAFSGTTETGVGWKHFLSRKEQNPLYSILQVSLKEPVEFQVFSRHFLMLKIALLKAMTLNLLLMISLVLWVNLSQ